MRRRIWLLAGLRRLLDASSPGGGPRGMPARPAPTPGTRPCKPWRRSTGQAATPAIGAGGCRRGANASSGWTQQTAGPRRSGRDAGRARQAVLVLPALRRQPPLRLVRRCAHRAGRVSGPKRPPARCGWCGTDGERADPATPLNGITPRTPRSTPPGDRTAGSRAAAPAAPPR